MARKRKKDKKDPTPPQPELGRKKKWAFRIISLVMIPLLFFGGLEVCLRLAGFGYPTAALIERDFDGKSMCFPNAQFTWRFFPHQMARDFDDGLSFEKKKAPGTFRIFILGGSAARGTPEQMFSFGRLLEAMLEAKYPDVDFEVYNAAVTAINSHLVREIAKDCAKYDPDLFLLYLGNNEVVGPFGPGTVFAQALPSLQMIRASIAVKSTRVGQLVDGLVGSISSGGTSAKEWGGIAMFLDKQVRPDSPALQSVYGNFAENLEDICRIAHRSGAKTVVSNVGVNLRNCAPFASLHRDDLNEEELKKWEAIYQEGVDLEDEEQYPLAIERFLEAAEIDDTYAELQFRLGRCYWETGKYDDARRHYQLALQNDSLRFRADEQINDVIRKVAEGRTEDGIYFVDSVAAFEAISPHRIPGAELFYEHVHLKFKGNYLLARAFFPIVQQLLPSTAKPRGELLSEEQVAQSVAYTECDEYSDLNTMYRDYLGRPPFTNQLYHEESMRNIKDELDRMRVNLDAENCLEEYEQAIQERPNDWRLLVKEYQLKFGSTGNADFEVQERMLNQLIAIHPYDGAYQVLGNLLLLQGRLNESEAVLKKSLFMNPVLGSAYYSLANLSLKRNDRASAIRQLQEAIRVAPAVSITTYRLLASQYDNEEKTDLAIQTLQKAIDLFSAEKTAMVHCHLGELLNKQGKSAEALEHMETALQIDPELAKLDAFNHQYRLIKGN